MHNESRTGRQGDNSCIKDRKTGLRTQRKDAGTKTTWLRLTVRSCLRPCHGPSAPQRSLQNYQTDLHPRQKSTPTQSHSARGHGVPVSHTDVWSLVSSSESVVISIFPHYQPHLWQRRNCIRHQRHPPCGRVYIRCARCHRLAST